MNKLRCVEQADGQMLCPMKVSEPWYAKYVGPSTEEVEQQKRCGTSCAHFKDADALCAATLSDFSRMSLSVADTRQLREEYDSDDTLRLVAIFKTLPLEDEWEKPVRRKACAFMFALCQKFTGMTLAEQIRKLSHWVDKVAEYSGDKGNDNYDAAVDKVRGFFECAGIELTTSEFAKFQAKILKPFLSGKEVTLKGNAVPAMNAAMEKAEEKKNALMTELQNSANLNPEQAAAVAQAVQKVVVGTGIMNSNRGNTVGNVNKKSFRLRF